MYTEYFGLNEKPFSISPDPRYLYLSQRHADALAHLVYGISESGGFIQLTGEVGTGKTTLIRSLLGQLPGNTEIALILNPRLSTKQFLQSICDELRIPTVSRDTAKSLIDKLNARLLELHSANRRVVLIVDEAQTMSPELLEQVRLLTNLETVERKLLQIILIGQPELRDVLGQQEMRQVAQRITGRYHLEPLDAPDTSVYVAHRMRIAGGRPETFSKRAIRRLYRLSHGVPRLINIIADRALLAAYSTDQTRIGASMVRRAADEVLGRSRTIRWWPWAAAIAAIALLFVVTLPGGEQSPQMTLELALAEIPSTRPRAGDTVALPNSAAETGQRQSPPLSRLLETNDTDAEAATRALLGAWGIDAPDPDIPACDQAAAHGLKCLSLAATSLVELRTLNRPITLELKSGPDSTHHVALLGIDDRHARIAAGGTIGQFSAAELNAFDLGRQALLFRPAITIPVGGLAEGARGPAVIWLKTALADIVDWQGPSIETDLFDPSLSVAVRAYQRSRELFVDGVIDDLTLLHLQNDIGLTGLSLRMGTP